MSKKWLWLIVIVAAARFLPVYVRQLREESAEYQKQTTAVRSVTKEEPVESYLPDPKAETWQLYALSNSYAGPKIYDLSQGEGCAAGISFSADGTWTGYWHAPGGNGSDSGTWTDLGDRYSLTGLLEPLTIFKEGEDLYQIVEEGGNQAWLWFCQASLPLTEASTTGPIVGTWELWAISDTYNGSKDPVRDGTETTFCFNADGTWSFQDISAGGSMTDSGTWTAHGGDRYVLIDPAGVRVPPVFREGDTLYQLMGESGGPRLYAWFRKR